MTPALNEAEQAKQELLNRLKEGKLDGIESILDKVTPEDALLASFYKDLDPEVVDKFYAVTIKYYESKEHCKQIASLWKYMQKRHRTKYNLELEVAQ